MKKILVFMLLLIPLSVFGQQKFFGPVTNDIFKTPALAAIEKPSVWLFRPAVSFDAVKLTYDKVLKKVQSEQFTQVGVGVSYQHFIESAGEPYNNFGVNVVANVGLSSVPVTIGLSATVNLWQYFDFGLGYDFTGKQLFALTGVVYHFN